VLKFLLFLFIWFLTGNLFVTILIILLVLYALERRFVGITPSFMAPLKRMRRTSLLRQEVALNPHHTSNKLELARSLMDRGKFQEALPLLKQAREVMSESAEVLTDLGYCLLKLGQLTEGEQYMVQGFQINPRVKYAEPYLQLGEGFAQTNPDKAVAYLTQYQTYQTSSCKGYYRLGQLYRKLGRAAEAQEMFRETVQSYRSLPKYKKRTERKWAILASMKRLG
jgi:tetratricopeptide (TPR) repeat protein